jgi:hypothetical protein
MKDMENQQLSDVIIEKFITTFFGYGNLDSDYWYIGMEEGGGNSFQEINQRMLKWKSMGSAVTIDLKKYHLAIGIDKFFTEKPKLQKTWSRLIRIHLRLNQAPCTTEAIRSYQRKFLGREAGDNCLLELMPLPSPGINQWKYNRLSQLPYLRSRKDYWDHVLPKRISKLREIIKRNRPKVVIFYGCNSKYLKAWSEIASLRFQDSPIKQLSICKNNQTLFAVCPHPVATGLTNDYYDSIGHYLRKPILHVGHQS